MTGPLICLTIFSLSGVACSRGTDTAASPPPPAASVSGIELDSVDRNVRPQDNLFHHASGTRLARTPIPADRASYGAVDMLIDKSQADLRDCGGVRKAPNRVAGSAHRRWATSTKVSWTRHEPRRWD